MTRLLLSTALLLTACPLDPASVGDTLGDTDEGTSGEAGSDTGAAQTTEPTSTTTSPPEDDDDPQPPDPVECPDAEYTSCQDATRSLVLASFDAIATRREQYEGARMVLTAELGLSEPATDAALALALEAAGLGSLGMGGEGSCDDSLPPATAFLEQCEDAPVLGAFGCQGVCKLEASQTAACVEQGRIRCFSSNQTCSGLCVGGCNEGPGACDGTCSGACEGSCACAEDGFCLGSCSGVCTGPCFRAEPVQCAGACLGLCEYETVETPECSPSDPVFECVDGGPGSCASDCRGVATPPADASACCGPLVGLAALLETSCSGPTLDGLGCGTSPDGKDGVIIALDAVLSIRAQLQRIEAELPTLQAAIEGHASAAPGSCEAEAWQVDAQTLALAASELGDLLVELDALAEALLENG